MQIKRRGIGDTQGEAKSQPLPQRERGKSTPLAFQSQFRRLVSVQMRRAGPSWAHSEFGAEGAVDEFRPFHSPAVSVVI